MAFCWEILRGYTPFQKEKVPFEISCNTIFRTVQTVDLLHRGGVSSTTFWNSRGLRKKLFVAKQKRPVTCTMGVSVSSLQRLRSEGGAGYCKILGAWLSECETLRQKENFGGGGGAPLARRWTRYWSTLISRKIPGKVTLGGGGQGSLQKEGGARVLVTSDGDGANVVVSFDLFPSAFLRLTFIILRFFLGSSFVMEVEWKWLWSQVVGLMWNGTATNWRRFEKPVWTFWKAPQKSVGRSGVSHWPTVISSNRYENSLKFHFCIGIMCWLDFQFLGIFGIKMSNTPPDQVFSPELAMNLPFSHPSLPGGGIRTSSVAQVLSGLMDISNQVGKRLCWLFHQCLTFHRFAVVGRSAGAQASTQLTPNETSIICCSLRAERTHATLEAIYEWRGRRSRPSAGSLG